MKTATLLILLGMLIGAPSLQASDSPRAVLTDQGGSDQWLILWTESNPVAVATTGQAKALGYFLVPKTAAARIEILNQGAAARIYIPAPGHLDSAGSGTVSASPPSGLPLLNPGSMSWSLQVSPGLFIWLQSLSGAKATVNYKDPSSPTGVHAYNVGDLTPDVLRAGLEASLIAGQESFVTVLADGMNFQESDLSALTGAFSFTIKQIESGATAESGTFAFPDVSALASLTGAAKEPFYSALDQIDTLIYPAFAGGDGLRALGGQGFAETRHRAFLESALSHYFRSLDSGASDACSESGYLTGLRTEEDAQAESTAYSYPYFSPVVRDIQIGLKVQ